MGATIGGIQMAFRGRADSFPHLGVYWRRILRNQSFTIDIVNELIEFKTIQLKQTFIIVLSLT